MSYFELLPTELNEIIISYVALNDPTDIEILQPYLPIQKIISNKYFWINTSISNELEEYSAYFNLISGTEYLKAYENILDIKKYIKLFIEHYSDFTLPIFEDIDITKLLDPSDLSYFKSHVNFKLLRKSYSSNRFETRLYIEPCLGYPDNFLSKVISGVHVLSELNMITSNFIILLIKSKIFNINIWVNPVSTLLKRIEREKYDYY